MATTTKTSNKRPPVSTPYHGPYENAATSSTTRVQSGHHIINRPATASLITATVTDDDDDDDDGLSMSSDYALPDQQQKANSRNNGDEQGQTTFLTPGQAGLLARLSKPFDQASYQELLQRIDKRRRYDEALEEKRKVEEDVDDSYDQLDHDPKLADGKTLPKPVAKNFPKNLIGMPIEDIDPRHREYEKTFLVIGQRFNRAGHIYRFSASPSLFIFNVWNPVRRLALYASIHPLFDIIVIMTILANCVFMAMNVTEQVPELTFLAVYSLEAIIKVIARGAFLDKFTYLRDPWNWLDFVILLVAYATIIVQNTTSGTRVSLNALRAFRVFRVLKTVAILPGLRTIIEAMFRAFKNLKDVLILTFFMFTIAALFGVQLFQGSLQTKCVHNADAAGVKLAPDNSQSGIRWGDWVSNSSNWAFHDDGWEWEICGNFSMARRCPVNYTCILVVGSNTPNYNFTNFDSFISSFLVAIQIFNTDYWDYLYDEVVSANGPSTILFFIIAILFLNYYLANLVQAVVVLSYQVDEEDVDEDDDANEMIAEAKKKGRRFVFDPAQLRIIKLGAADAVTRSLRSIKSATDRRYSSSSQQQQHEDRSSTYRAPADSENKHNNKPLLPPVTWPNDNNLRYRIKSHPPSIVAEEELPKIGFWDHNPHCCFDCCLGFFSWLKFQHVLFTIVTDPFFDLFITISIVINTGCMAAHYDGIPDNVDNVLDEINNVCTYIFITEAILKITAMCGQYFENRWNWLDFIVVIGSVLDITINNIDIQGAGFNTSIIRLLRLLRILKLAQSWKAMRILLEIIFGTVAAIANLMLVLMIVMFIFAIIGMQLFGTSYTADKFTAPGAVVTFTPFAGNSGVPPWNWSDFLHSFMEVFRVLCRETYQPMFDCATANSFSICTPYYLLMLFLGSYVVLNLFLAVLLNAFSSEDLKKKNSEDDDTRLKRRFQAVKKYFAAKFAQLRLKLAPGNVVVPTTPIGKDERSTIITTEDQTSTTPNDEDEDDDTRKPGNKSESSFDTEKIKDCCSPCCDVRFPNFMARFRRDSPEGATFFKFRTLCFKIVEHRGFEFTILGFIFFSSITLCLQDATLHDDSQLAIALSYLDYIYLAVFTIEMVVKLFGLGVTVYFTSFWTILDALIVVTGYIDITVNELGSTANLTALRALRTLRALRPLRAISRWQGMKIVVNALIAALPGIVNVLLVVMIIWLIFAIMGVQFFAGMFWMCVDVATGNRLPAALVPNKETCLSNPNNWQWSLNPINFDNVAYAYLALFQVATFEGWTSVMEFGIDAADEKDDQPSIDNNVNYYIYFLIFIVICSFFLLNLFVGVIIDDFNNLKKKYEGSRILDLFMTDSQKNYYKTIKKIGLKKPRQSAGRPSNQLSIFCYEAAVSTRMEFAVAGVIGANAVVMATEHFNQEIVYTVAQELFNNIFTIVFALEAVLKIIGLRIHYFRSAWNMFDLSIVIVSILSMALSELFAAAHISPSMLRVLRVLRVARVVRIVRTSKGIRKLMFSLIMSLPALFNIICLLLLIIFIYAIIGMNLFGHVGHFGGNLDDVTNFHTFPYALLTLFRLTTVSGWDNIHQGLSFTDDRTIGCNPNISLSNPRYPQLNPCCNRTAWMRPNGEIVLDSSGWGNCGSFPLATVYIISYLLFTYFIIVNMFAAVVLDFYQDATNQDEIGVTDEDVERFYVVWEQYDPLATQFVKLEDLSSFIASLGSPLGCPKPNLSAIALMDIPILADSKYGEEVVHCVDVLMAVVRKALGSVDETEEFKLVRSHLESVINSTFPNRIQAEKVSTTKFRKKQEVAARIIQRRWRKCRAMRGMRHLPSNQNNYAANHKRPSTKVHFAKQS